MKLSDMKNPRSPCNNDCDFDSDTGLCRGCLRTMDEIAEWATMGPEQRLAVLSAVEERELAGAADDG